MHTQRLIAESVRVGELFRTLLRHFEPAPGIPTDIEAPPPLPNIILPRLPPDLPYHLPPGYHYPDNLPEGHPGHYYPGMPPYPVIAP